MGQRVMNSRAFRRVGSFAYLDDADRWLTAQIQPRFKFGFIGCGMMGIEHMHNALLSGSGSVSGIFDPAAKSISHAQKVLAKIQPQLTPKVYSSLREACQDPATDALIIATPNYTHLEVMRAVSQCGKAIFLEKPIATTIDDAAEICRLAGDHPNVVRIGLQYRHKAIYAEAIKEVFTQRSVGAVKSINMLEHRFPFLDKVGQWNKFDVHTGGTLVEKCCHYFDLINLFAGSRAGQVFAVGSQAVNFHDFSRATKQADGLDQAHAIINYSNGVIGAFSLSMFVHGACEELIICGDEGRLQVSEQAQLGDGNANRLELWAGENGASKVSAPTYPAYIAKAGHHGSTYFEHLDFIEDLTTGIYRGPSLGEAFYSIAVATAAQRSISEGAAIDMADVVPSDFDPQEYCPEQI